MATDDTDGEGLTDAQFRELLRSTSIEELKAALNVPRGDAVILEAASEHKYTCRCSACLHFWMLTGPDGGEAGNYGPFTEREILNARREQGLPEHG